MNVESGLSRQSDVRKTRRNSKQQRQRWINKAVAVAMRLCGPTRQESGGGGGGGGGGWGKHSKDEQTSSHI